MTQHAIIVGRHMRAMLADNRITVVATNTVVRNTSVIIPGAGKRRRVMTIRAIPVNTVHDSRRMIDRFRGDGRH